MPRKAPEMAQEMPISLPICGCTWLGSDSSLSWALRVARETGGSSFISSSPGLSQVSMEGPELIPSRNNTLWGLKRLFLHLKSFQITPQPWLLCVQMPCQPANSELEEFIKLKMPFTHLLLSHHIYAAVSGAFWNRTLP